MIAVFPFQHSPYSPFKCIPNDILRGLEFSLLMIHKVLFRNDLNILGLLFHWQEKNSLRGESTLRYCPYCIVQVTVHDSGRQPISPH